MDLLEALRLRGISYHRQVLNPAEVYVCCPFCETRGESADKRFRLGLNMWRGFGHC